MKNQKVCTVTILTYPGMTLLDAVGPNEVLANSPYFDVQWACTEKQPIQNDLRSFSLSQMAYFQDITHTDILLVPGGPGDKTVMESPEVLTWIATLDRQSKLTASVCSGSLILAKAGLLANIKACSHWACLSELSELGAKPVRKRFIQSGKYVTASGVSAGIDMALYLVEQIVSKKHARQIRFGIEYFPNQLNLISSYTLPWFMLAKLADKVKHILDKARAELA